MGRVSSVPGLASVPREKLKMFVDGSEGLPVTLKGGGGVGGGTDLLEAAAYWPNSAWRGWQVEGFFGR